MKKITVFLLYLSSIITGLLFALLVGFLLTSCAEEEWRISDDCYKLDHPDVYIESLKAAGLNEGNIAIWAVSYQDVEVQIGCSWAEAYTYMWQYNCDNYPNTFSELYVVMRTYQTPCESI